MNANLTNNRNFISLQVLTPPSISSVNWAFENCVALLLLLFFEENDLMVHFTISFIVFSMNIKTYMVGKKP
jgi:hypothetical protein